MIVYGVTPLLEMICRAPESYLTWKLELLIYGPRGRELLLSTNRENLVSIPIPQPFTEEELFNYELAFTMMEL